jgi:hypothetical protein
MDILAGRLNQKYWQLQYSEWERVYILQFVQGFALIAILYQSTNIGGVWLQIFQIAYKSHFVVEILTLYLMASAQNAYPNTETNATLFSFYASVIGCFSSFYFILN